MSFQKGQRVRCVRETFEPDNFGKLGYVYTVKDPKGVLGTFELEEMPGKYSLPERFELFIDPGFKVGDVVTPTRRWTQPAVPHAPSKGHPYTITEVHPTKGYALKDKGGWRRTGYWGWCFEDAEAWTCDLRPGDLLKVAQRVTSCGKDALKIGDQVVVVRQEYSGSSVVVRLVNAKEPLPGGGWGRDRFKLIARAGTWFDRSSFKIVTGLPPIYWRSLAERVNLDNGFHPARTYGREQQPSRSYRYGGRYGGKMADLLVQMDFAKIEQRLMDQIINPPIYWVDEFSSIKLDPKKMDDGLRDKVKALVIELAKINRDATASVISALGYQRLVDVPDAKLAVLQTRLLNLKCALAPVEPAAPKPPRPGCNFKTGDRLRRIKGALEAGSRWGVGRELGEIVVVLDPPYQENCNSVRFYDQHDPRKDHIITWEPQEHFELATEFKVGDKVRLGSGDLTWTIKALDTDRAWVRCDKQGAYQTRLIADLVFDTVS